MLWNEIEKEHLESDIGYQKYIKGMGNEELEKILKFCNKPYGGASSKQFTARRSNDAPLFCAANGLHSSDDNQDAFSFPGNQDLSCP